MEKEKKKVWSNKKTCCSTNKINAVLGFPSRSLKEGAVTLCLVRWHRRLCELRLPPNPTSPKKTFAEHKQEGFTNTQKSFPSLK